MASWLAPLLHGDSIAGLVLVLGVVIASGIALGAVKIRGVSIGIAGVLFTGILYAHVAWRAPAEAAAAAPAAPAAVAAHAAPADVGHGPATAAVADPAPTAQAAPPPAPRTAAGHGHGARTHLLEFLREFGLILFVYSIGMQLGPGFFSSLRAQGLRWNLLAAAVVLGGGGMAVIAHALGGLPGPVGVGVLSGAVTNTPGLAAAQQAMKEVPGLSEADLNLPAMGYAVAYPFGVLGVILSMIALRIAFRIDPLREAQAFRASGAGGSQAPASIDLAVRNPGLAGLALGRLGELAGGKIAISRLMRGATVTVADPDRLLQLGDVIHAIGDAAALERLRVVVGEVADIKLTEVGTDLDYRLMLVTHAGAVGRTVAEIDLPERCRATITRVHRAGIEFVAADNVRLLFGDQVRVVGDRKALDEAAAFLGNSVKQAEHPQLIPVFVGIALGVLLGSIPIAIPDMPAPVKLGLAGGPLIVALLMSNLGRVGGLNFYLSPGANLMIRELGIVLFLACVGLKAGDTFVATVLDGDGLLWMGWAMAITLVPVLAVGLIARLALGMNYTALSGLMAGSMTDPPALAFANATAQSDAPAITYATVYPLTMILRVLSAQLYVLGIIA